MKVIIAGGRDFKDFELLVHSIWDLDLVTEVVSGKARGADSLGEQWAKENNIPISAHPADWDTHGKSAGYIRNSEMADYADALLAFWDGKSKGTKHMIDLATKKGLEVKVVKYNTIGKITVGRVHRDMPYTTNIRIDRGTPLGNPFYMQDESQRDTVCDKYEEHFDKNVALEGDLRNEVIRLYRLVRDGYSINLQCWCAPKRCHGDTIKNFILEQLGEIDV